MEGLALFFAFTHRPLPPPRPWPICTIQNFQRYSLSSKNSRSRPLIPPHRSPTESLRQVHSAPSLPFKPTQYRKNAWWTRCSRCRCRYHQRSFLRPPRALRPRKTKAGGRLSNSIQPTRCSRTWAIQKEPGNKQDLEQARGGRKTSDDGIMLIMGSLNAGAEVH